MKRLVCFVCLSAALLLPAGNWQAHAMLGSGGSYVLESSVVDNGGGGWVQGGAYSVRGSLGQAAASRSPQETGIYSSRAGFYNPPHLKYQRGLEAKFALTSGEMFITLVPNSVSDREMFEIGVNKGKANLLVERLGVRGVVDDANRKMAVNEGIWAQFNDAAVTEVYIHDEQSIALDPLPKAGLLSMRYYDTITPGIVDNTNPPVLVDTLDGWVLNEETRMWALLPNRSIDTVNKTITVSFRGPGVYNMIGAMATQVDRVKAYPVPFRPNGPQAGTGEGQTGTEAAGIIFGDIGASVGEISIYTLAGQLVRKLDIASNLIIEEGSFKVRWNVKNTAGSKVASGVYIWRVVSGGNSKVGKLMVIW